MTEPTETVSKEVSAVTVFEHHDADGAIVNVALLRPRSWHFLTVEEARDLANKLLEAADVAEECSRESQRALGTR